MLTSPTIRSIFRSINRYFMTPLFRIGLGPFVGNPLTGYIMIVKTIGRRSHALRYTPVNYAIMNGNVYCLAGFGRASDWYRNLRLHDVVELILPAGVVTGHAEEVSNPDEALHAARQVLMNSGFASYAAGVSARTVSDVVLSDRLRGAPVIRIRPNGVHSGPADPGGWLWIPVFALSVGIGVWLTRRWRQS
jgi:deazaflavin-dependent oxidoreductase (nitroreductase family)